MGGNCCTTRDEKDGSNVPLNLEGKTNEEKAKILGEQAKAKTLEAYEKAKNYNYKDKLEEIKKVDYKKKWAELKEVDYATKLKEG